MQRILQPGEIEALDRVSFPRVRLPQPASLFQERAARLRQRAEGHPIADYLRFAARLVEAQQRLAVSLPQMPVDGDADGGLPEDSPGDALRRAAEQAQAHGMPLLPAAGSLPRRWREALRALVAGVSADAAVPEPLQAVLRRLAGMDDAALDQLAHQALADNVAREDLAAMPLVMAALQVVFALRASLLDERMLPYTDPATICPVCGSAPVASVLRIGGEAGGHRYLHCGLCATEWHMVRVKCSHCESTEGVRYQGMEGADGAKGDQAVLAETCGQCHTYRKLVNQEKDPFVEPLADDLASITLDLLMGDTEFSRSSSNPLLAIEKPLAV